MSRHNSQDLSLCELFYFKKILTGKLVSGKLRMTEGVYPVPSQLAGPKSMRAFYFSVYNIRILYII